MIGRMLVPAAVIGVLGLLRRYLPARKTNPQSQLDSNVDVEDFTSANFAVYACMVAVGVAFALAVHWVLAAGNRYFAQTDGPAAFQFFPSGATWWFFPGFGALCLSWEITLFFWSLLEDRSKVDRFIAWTSERAGYDSTRALRWMAVVLATPIWSRNPSRAPDALHSSRQRHCGRPLCNVGSAESPLLPSTSPSAGRWFPRSIWEIFCRGRNDYRF